jgi:hypothetical protein
MTCEDTGLLAGIPLRFPRFRGTCPPMLINSYRPFATTTGEEYATNP